MSLFLDVGGSGLGSGSSYVRLDPTKVAQVMRGSSGPVVSWMIRLGEQVKDKAQEEVGVDTGNLRDHIVKRLVMHGDGVSVVIGADVPYTIYHHEGSEAVEGKLMVFEVDGITVFTMRRKAIPPNRFLIRALNHARSLV